MPDDLPADLVGLSAGNLELSIAPSKGGSIANFHWVEGQRRTPLLRECNTPPENALASASFPLVPYVNRIREGKFHFRGREVKIEPNMPGDPSPLHGQGWLGEWQVESAGPNEAVLRFEHEAGEWPWSYRAGQQFSLDQRGLAIVLSCRNLSAEPMPCGLGQHPYFSCSDGTRIATEVTHAWTIDENVLPVERVAASGRFDLADRSVCGLGLDHGFGGWGGSARLSDPAWPVEIIVSSPDARFFQLYSPESGGLFVAEPVTHANAALNACEERWAELGMRVLEPGEAMKLTMRIEIVTRAVADQDDRRG